MHAGAFAYNAFLSIFPLLLLLSSVLGFILKSYPSIHEKIMEGIYSAIPDFGSVIENTLKAIQSKPAVVGIIGLVGLLWTGTRIVYSLERGFRDVWGTEKRGFLKGRLLGVLVIAMVGVLGLASAGTYVGVSSFRNNMLKQGGAWTALAFLIAILFRLIFNFLLFFLIYMVVPKRKQLASRVAKGAFFSAVLFLLLQYVLDFYFGSLSHATVLYGTIGVVISLMVWLYFTGMIAFLGAEFIRALPENPETGEEDSP